MISCGYLSRRREGNNGEQHLGRILGSSFWADLKAFPLMLLGFLKVEDYSPRRFMFLKQTASVCLDQGPNLQTNWDSAVSSVKVPACKHSFPHMWGFPRNFLISLESLKSLPNLDDHFWLPAYLYKVLLRQGYVNQSHFVISGTLL